MTKTHKIGVRGVPVTLLQTGGETLFISLTDSANAFAGGPSLIEKWLCRSETLLFLSLWEQLHNPDFRASEAAKFRAAVSRPYFALSLKQWTGKTGAVGFKVKADRSGSGTFAQPDIAFEFAGWLSLEFKMHLMEAIEQFRREGTGATRGNWDLQRRLSKTNYKMQARAIKQSILPGMDIPKGEEGPVYAGEGDMLNLAVFGKTSQQWKEENPAMARKGFNIRDTADLPQLTVLSNLASYNALLIQQGLSKGVRLPILEGAAAVQLQSLVELPYPSARGIQSPHAKEAA